VFIVAVYFIINSVHKRLDIPLYTTFTCNVHIMVLAAEAEKLFSKSH